jgi:hypothetical protein
MKRRVFGVILVLHGLAHAFPGSRAMDRAAGWLSPQIGAGNRIATIWIALLLAATVTALIAAGLGALRVRAFRPHWIGLAYLGAGVSLVLLFPWWPPFALYGILVDLLILLALWFGFPIEVKVLSPAPPAVGGPVRRGLARVGNLACLAAVTYMAIVVLARPWYMRWGARDAELHQPLPGDEVPPYRTASYAIHHAVTIQAPVEAVWPWLMQLGQDRGGFYSHAWLENLAGLHVRNADRVHPEWQQRSAGDTVFATPRGWLGFRGRFGWEVTGVEPNRVLVLRNWGAFVLIPIDSVTSRLIVRTRGAAADKPFFLPLGWVNVWIFEPAHFIMQRGMLLGIKRRAEAPRAR